MREGERDGFLALMERAFADEDASHFARYLDEDPLLGNEDTLLAVEGGRIVSALQVFTRTIRLRGQPVALGGIGSVATHPEHEGRGLASELLRRAIRTMGARGMAISLLFTARPAFYRRLGWVDVRHPVLVVRGGAAGSSAGAESFVPRDLPRIRDLYARYSGSRDGTTIRDDRYWHAQLRFAGSPDEHFAVARRDGRIVAYARRIPFLGLARIMEHGCEPGAEADLAGLLLSLGLADAPLFVPACDVGLERALVRAGARCETVMFPDQMWRVIDGRRLRAIAGVGEDLDDAALLEALVRAPGGVYWPSDRF
jgi:predicted N-acetyltransferase YhbS